MKLFSVILSLSCSLPSVVAQSCERSENYCGGVLRNKLGYREGQMVSAAQKNTALPEEARNERTGGWVDVIFNCVDGESIQALEYCDDGDICEQSYDNGTEAVCQIDL